MCIVVGTAFNMRIIQTASEQHKVSRFEGWCYIFDKRLGS